MKIVAAAMKPFALGQSLGTKFPKIVDDLMDKYLPRGFTVAKFKALPAKKHTAFLDDLYDALENERRARPLLSLLEKIPLAQEFALIEGMLDGIEEDEPQAPKAPITKPAPKVVPPQANIPVKKNADGVPIVTVGGSTKTAYAKAQESSPSVRTAFMKALWQELNGTKFQSAMTMPNMRFLKDMGDKLRKYGHWSKRNRELAFAPKLFNAPLDIFLETFLHEMCHQAVSEIDKVEDNTAGGHGPNWVAWMRKVGLDPRRYNNNDPALYIHSDERDQFVQKQAERKAQIENHKKELETKKRMWSPQPDKPALAAVNGKILPGLIVCPTDQKQSVWAFIPAGSFKAVFYRVPQDLIYEVDDPDQVIQATTPLLLRLASEIREYLGKKADNRSLMKTMQRLRIFG